MTFHAKLIKGGKIVIPAELRRDLGFRDGDRLVIEREGNSLVLKSYGQVVREVQDKVAQLVVTPFTVDDFIAEKRREAISE